MTRIELTGLDGGNLLAYLAALGTLATASEMSDAGQVRLSWEARGKWRPILWTSMPWAPETLVTRIAQELGKLGDAPFRIPEGPGSEKLANNLKMSAAAYRSYAAAALATGTRRHTDFAATFACDATASAEDQIADTAFRTMSGAGHQDFLRFMRDLVAKTTEAHLSEALFGPWRYQDDSPVMRFDAEDDRRYALRWKEPSGDPIRTVRGANRLAIEALRLFPSVPAGSRLKTTGFKGTRSSDTFLTVPIWSEPLDRQVLQSVLTLADLQRDELDREARTTLRRRGVVDVLRTQRLTRDKYRSFSPMVSL